MGIFAMTAGQGEGEGFSSQAVLNWRNVWSSISRGIGGRGAKISRLAILESIRVGPKQSVALIEVEGKKLLVGTSPDGPPRFFALIGESGGEGNEHGLDVPLEGSVS